MAWRGRGRGRPGGFARHDITLKDDEQLSDVPQTYPPAPMPGKAPQQDDLEAETKRLLIRYQRMRKAFHNSPYHINAPVKDDHQGSRPDVRRYMDKESHQDTKTNKVALHQVVRLHKTYMPSELYSAKDARASLRQKAPVARASLQADTEEEQALGSSGKLPEKGEGEEGKEQAGDSDKEDAEPDEEEDDELDREDDDYYQGEHFDDDEEYGVDDDDGEGEAYY